MKNFLALLSVATMSLGGGVIWLIILLVPVHAWVNNVSILDYDSSLNILLTSALFVCGGGVIFSMCVWVEKGYSTRFLVLWFRVNITTVCLLWPLSMMSLALPRVIRDGVDVAFVVYSLVFWILGITFAHFLWKYLTEYANEYHPKRAP